MSIESPQSRNEWLTGQVRHGFQMTDIEQICRCRSYNSGFSNFSIPDLQRTNSRLRFSQKLPGVTHSGAAVPTSVELELVESCGGNKHEQQIEPFLHSKNMKTANKSGSSMQQVPMFQLNYKLGQVIIPM